MSFKTIELNNNLIKRKEYNNNQLEPILELYKGKLYCYLINLFINDCVNTFGYQIFSIKKSVSRTLTNLLSSWIFSLYINYDYSGDFFLPNNYEDVSSLEETLKDLCKYNKEISNLDEKIKYVTNNLKVNYKNQLELLNNYKSSHKYINNKYNYRITKNKTTLKKNSKLLFYKLNINVNFVIKDKRLNNILNNILLPINIYDKMVSLYNRNDNKVDDYIWCIVYRYQLLGSNNHQLGMLPDIMKQMQKDYNLNFECFASSINSTFPNYCSIYYDIEKYFGSMGSFFNIIPLKGTFGFNPPYQKNIITNSIEKLFTYLNDSKEDLTFIITIPIWDNLGKTIMKTTYNNEYEKQNIDYGEFDIINKIKISKYFKCLRMIPKEKFTYLDHNFELYKNKTIQNTYVIILSNKTINADNLFNYDFYNYPLT